MNPSFVSSVFDPIGLVAPYTVKARLLLKDIWRISGQKWDDDLPEEIKKLFLEWHSGPHLLGSLTIPRSYFTDSFDRIDLHMFGDSSQNVFCAVAFLCARLASSHATELAFGFLQWLNSCNKLPVFVGDRTDEILESTTTDQWHHILSGDNPVDTGTRGFTSKALKESSWVNGASILRTTDWPYKPDTRVIDKIRLKGPSCDIDICMEDSSNFVVDVLTEKKLPFEKWERFISIVKYTSTVAFC